MQYTILLSALAASLASAAPSAFLPLGPSVTFIDVTQPPPRNLLQSRTPASVSARARRGAAAVTPQLFIEDPADSKKCAVSNFADRTTAFSASLEDCLCIAENLAQPEWKGKFLMRPIDGTKFGATAVGCRSCAFLVATDDEFGTNVGADDVREFIEEAVDRFGAKTEGERLGASGETVCENDSGREGTAAYAQTTWLLAHVPN